jgi:U4/U6.U5 tri-snRNP-associated protein 1
LLTKAFIIGESQASGKSNKQDGQTCHVAISLDYESKPFANFGLISGPLEIVSDYVDPSTIKIKKLKKKKTKNIARANKIRDDDTLVERNDDTIMKELDEYAPMALSSTKRVINEDSGLGDDEELQEMLSRRRRQALKKRKITRPEEFVSNTYQMENEQDEFPSQEGGLIIDHTSEFVRSLEMAQQEAETRKAQDNEIPREMEIDQPNEAEDTEMVDETQAYEEVDKEAPSTGIEDEPVIASSMAATLAALKRSGIVPSSFWINFA